MLTWMESAEQKTKSNHDWSAGLASRQVDQNRSLSQVRTYDILTMGSHLETLANGQAVVFLTGLLEVFISEISYWQQYRTTLSVIKPSMGST